MVYRFSWMFLFLYLFIGLFFQYAPLDGYYVNLQDFKLLWILDSKNKFLYWSILSIIYFPVWYFLKAYMPRILDLSWLIIIGFSGVLFLESTFYSRVAFSLGLMPLLFNGLREINFLYVQQDIENFDIRKILTLIFALVLFIPGLYLPPFFDGISGWTFKEFNNDRITYWRLEVFDSYGNTVPFPYACFSPVTQEDRMYSSVAFPLKPPFLREIKEEVMVNVTHNFFKKAFSSCLEYMKIGLFPYQKTLGEFAYPTHNVSNSPKTNTYKDFEPSQYEGTQYVQFFFVKGSDGKYHELPKKILATFTAKNITME